MQCFLSLTQLRFVNFNSPISLHQLLCPSLLLENPPSAVAAWLRQARGLSLGIPTRQTNRPKLIGKSAQSVNLSAARVNSPSNQWARSIVPEPFFFFHQKGGASPSQSHPPRAAFLVDGVHRPAHIRPSTEVFVAPQERFHHGPPSNRLRNFSQSGWTFTFLCDCTPSVPVSSQLIFQHRRSLPSRAASPNQILGIWLQ